MELKSYFESLLELLYPEKNICFICGKRDTSIKDKYICNDCFEKLAKLSGNLCIKCSKPLNNINIDNICNECKKNIRYFETVKSPLKYSDLVQNIIYDFKYHNKAFYYKLLGQILFEYMCSNNYLNFDYIVPVPLHKSKLIERGFNQSELIAKYLSKKTKIPFSKCLIRIEKTKVQNNLSKIERKKNIKGAFSLHNSHIIKKKRILIIDDIYTTGATINECSRILLKNQALSVYGLTVARG